MLARTGATPGSSSASVRIDSGMQFGTVNFTTGGTVCTVLLALVDSRADRSPAEIRSVYTELSETCRRDVSLCQVPRGESGYDWRTPSEHAAGRRTQKPLCPEWQRSDATPTCIHLSSARRVLRAGKATRRILRGPPVENREGTCQRHGSRTLVCL